MSNYSLNGDIMDLGKPDNATTKVMIAEFEQPFKNWLKSIDPSLKFEDFELSIDSQIWPARNDFVGIYLINLPGAEKTLRFIYRRCANEPGFTCLLRNENSEVLFDICKKAKPDYVKFIQGLLPIKMGPKTIKAMEEGIALEKQMMQNNQTIKICRTLCAVAENGIISRQAMHDVLIEYNGREIKRIFLDGCIGRLAARGLIEVIKKNGEFIFALQESCYLEAKAYEYKENLGNIKNIEFKKQLAEQRKKTAEINLEKAQAEIANQDKLIAELDSEAALLNTKIESVNSSITQPQPPK